MHRLSSATDGSFARFAVLVFALCIPLAAQERGAPASVTSYDFGGHHNRTPGAPASVTSLGPNGYGHGARTAGPVFGSQPYFPSNGNRGGHGNRPGDRNHDRQRGYYGYAPVYAYPYGYGYSDLYPTADYSQPQDPADQYPEEEYRGGPTIFDRRGPGTPRRDDVPRPLEPADVASVEPAPSPEPARDQPSTILVFKDGRQLEVQNYAIVGNTLVDMTEGHHKKVPLEQLDVEATSKQNDDRGIDFRLPSQPLAN